ncbi:MAG: hypothetical protein AAFX05_02595 [Planctomycetota bacterium]
MKWFSKLCLVGLVAFAAACNNGGGDEEAGGGTETEAADTGAAAAGGSGYDSDGVEIGRETAASTLKMWLDHCSRGEWEEALAITDPAADGYSELEDMINTWAAASNNPEAVKGGLPEFLEKMFAHPFLEAKFNEEFPQETRVRYAVWVGNRDATSFDVVQTDGQWWVLPPKGAIQPDASVSPPGPVGS